MKNVLIINAHLLYEGWSTGSLNQYLSQHISQFCEAEGFTVKHTVIDQGYDVEEEVQKHAWADYIILQSPVNWFGTPWTHKKYIDEIFNAGLANQALIVDDGRSRQDPSKQYGTGGKMGGKKFMMSLTWNAPKEAFDAPDQYLWQGKGVEDAFLHISGCYKFCGNEILPTFSCFDVMKEPQIEHDIERLNQHLAAYIKRESSPKAA